MQLGLRCFFSVFACRGRRDKGKVRERQTAAYLSQQLFQVAFKTLSACQNHLIIFIDAPQNTACCAHNAFSFPQQLAVRYTSARPTLISQTENESLRGRVITSHPPVGVWGENPATETGVFERWGDNQSSGPIHRWACEEKTRPAISTRDTSIRLLLLLQLVLWLKGNLVSRLCLSWPSVCGERRVARRASQRGPFSPVAPG